MRWNCRVPVGMHGGVRGRLSICENILFDCGTRQALQNLPNICIDADGLPLNFKVYEATEVNAFACADGSVRVYSALMDAMDDNELLGVIGHEIGHVAHRDSRKAFQTALMTSALKDGIASRGGFD